MSIVKPDKTSGKLPNQINKLLPELLQASEELKLSFESYSIDKIK